MCQNQSESVNGFGKIDHCPSYMKSGSEDWRIKRRLLAKKKTFMGKIAIVEEWTMWSERWSSLLYIRKPMVSLFHSC